MIWSPDWREVTGEFRSLVGPSGRIEHHPSERRGPGNEELCLDAAMIGPLQANRCVVVSAGLHGVEGIVGSEIIRAWLRKGIPSGQRLVFLHLLNPCGFAWGSRVDEDNIDLNRNFLLPGECYEGCPPGLDAVADLLAPGPGVSRWNVFHLRLLWSLVRVGRKRLTATIAGGQYTHPRGIFFGGAGPSRLQRILQENLPRWVAGAREVLHIDFHTGLGRYGELQLLLPRTVGSPEAAKLQARFGPEAIPAAREARHFRTRGSLGPWCEALLPQVRYTLCPAEFGTFSPMKVLAALIQENQARLQGQPASSSARKRLARVFAPEDEYWRSRVLKRGVRLLDEALAE
jgi:hypothetical protein